MMHWSIPVLAAVLQQAGALLLGSTSECSSAADGIQFDSYNASFLNTTYYTAQNLNVSGILNNFSFCEVCVAINYAQNAQLVFVLWLPEAQQYQGRFLAVGNGGYAGTIDRDNMLKQLNSGMGFAVAGGNAGHDACSETDGNNYGSPGTSIPFLSHEERTRAWIHDAISLFTPLAKDLTTRYYGRQPRYMYYNGCSTGGAQGFALAQYHPELFDGIFAGAPGNYYDQLTLSFLWNAQALSGDGYLSQEALKFTTAAVLAACDELDGVKDGIIENPLNCHFDIESLACDAEMELFQRDEANETTHCLTRAQITAVKSIYAGATTVDTGARIYPGYDPGSEAQWYMMAGGLANNYTIPILQNLVYHDLAYDPSNFGWSSADVQLVNDRAGKLIDEIGTNLTSFQTRRGKMLTTQGWADEYVSPRWPILHLEELQNALPADQDISDFYSLFMVPGGGHCGSGQYYPQAPGNWHVMAPLINWVERNVKPQSILASDPSDGSGRTRRLCPWPATARYTGGDPDSWDSYVCE
ncbi:tannase and feruloyl esterase [Xylariaceae sp. FL0016]|nr:tannase and feruloyl esterase [Xylariaceae sp. FL0016]